MFTLDQRDRARDRVLALARADRRVTGGALTGSTSLGAGDRWSDVDLAFGIATGNEPATVLAEWTAELGPALGVVHFFDLRAGATVYRVFLLPECLEVDVAVAPEGEFGAAGPAWRLLFGTDTSRPAAPEVPVEHLVGLGWHHVIHAHAAIERSRPWLAEYWVSALRDHALELACRRLGLPSAYGRGFDQLGREMTALYEDALVRSLGPGEQRRALRCATHNFLDEVRSVQPQLAARLALDLGELAG